jgi:hypothetical protein
MDQDPLLGAVTQLHLDQLIDPLLAQDSVRGDLLQFAVQGLGCHGPVDSGGHLGEAEFEQGLEIEFECFFPRTIVLVRHRLQRSLAAASYSRFGAAVQPRCLMGRVHRGGGGRTAERAEGTRRW